MEIVTYILLLTWILKLLAIFNAIRWLNSDGPSYKKHLTKNKPESQADYDQAVEVCNGKKLPFGVKDFRLRRFVKRTGGVKVLTYVAGFFQKVLFRFNWLIIVTTVHLFIAGWLISLGQVTTSFSKDCYSSELYWLGVMALGANFLLSIEAIYSYAILDSYAISFHMQTPKEKGLLNELGLFVSRVLTTIISGATASYVAYIKCNALSGHITPHEPSLYNRFKIYLQCIYFTITTFTTVGYGDIVPENGAGQLIAFLIEIQSVSLIALVFASLLASRSKQE